MYQRCLFVVTILSSLGLPFWARARPPGSAALVVVGAPWAPASSVVDIVARADGSVLRGTGWTWVVVARSDEPGFADRLAARGAWLVIEGTDRTGCLGRAPTLQGRPS